MLTPQELQDIGFEKAVFRGYDMESVDNFLEPLTEDYIALYKENSVLKSKMRILVEKLEEYRRQESAMQSALLAAQKTCDRMVAEAEKKCAQLLHEAEETAAVKAQNVGAQLTEEQTRLEAAQLATSQFLDSMEKRLRRQIELMDELRKQTLPSVKRAEPKKEEPRAFDFEKEPIPPSTEEKADALIEEIGLHIEESLTSPVLTAPTLGEIAREDKPAAKRETHGDLSPEKQKIFETLNFGRITDKIEN